MVISEEIARVMRTFGKKLSKKEKLVLLEMLQFCDKNSQACSAAVKLVPMRSVLLAVILERERRLQSLTRDFELEEELEQVC
jgi:hypothetical protein